MRRVRSADLLRRMISLLDGPLLCGRDRAYARARPAPSLATDRASTSGDRALDTRDLEWRIAETWRWFAAASYWSRSTFLLGCLKRVEAHLLHAVGVQAKTVLASEERAMVTQGKYTHTERGL